VGLTGNTPRQSERFGELAIQKGGEGGTKKKAMVRGITTKGGSVHWFYIAIQPLLPIAARIKRRTFFVPVGEGQCQVIGKGWGEGKRKHLIWSFVIDVGQ